MKKYINLFILSAFIFTSIIFLSGSDFDTIKADSSSEPGTFNNPIIDSNMTLNEALEGLSVKCPDEIKEKQCLVTVKYLSFDDKIHQGQFLIDRELKEDILFAFEEALIEKFPIHSVIPVSHNNFRKNGQWDDDLSMEANNSSGFNYRLITGGNTISMHALGRAVDINPVQNPYINRNLILPKGSGYNPQTPGTLTEESAIVKALVLRGWTWGGNWTALKDYQHLEKN